MLRSGGDRLFMSTTWADFAAVLAPKVQGTENLDRLMQEKNVDLEFFTLFSSVVAIAGNAGQTAYAAANLFMEGIVRQRQQARTPRFSCAYWSLGRNRLRPAPRASV